MQASRGAKKLLSTPSGSASALNLYHPNRDKRGYTTYSQLPEEHQMIYDMCRKFADEELAPNAGKWDKEHSFPTRAVSKLVSHYVCVNTVHNVTFVLVLDRLNNDRLIRSLCIWKTYIF